jgi:hypothetical protein
MVNSKIGLHSDQVGSGGLGFLGTPERTQLPGPTGCGMKTLFLFATRSRVGMTLRCPTKIGH